VISVYPAGSGLNRRPQTLEQSSRICQSAAEDNWNFSLPISTVTTGFLTRLTYHVLGNGAPERLDQLGDSREDRAIVGGERGVTILQPAFDGFLGIGSVPHVLDVRAIRSEPVRVSIAELAVRQPRTVHRAEYPHVSS
jgi:hypothetical protein